MRVLALGPESYGGFGGIAQGTRDFLSGLETSREVEGVTLLARRRPDGGPPKPAWLTERRSSGAPWRYAQQALALAGTGRFDLVFCLHVNLMPVAAAVKRLFGLPVWLTIHGIDAWTPPGILRRRCVAAADLVTASSRYTRERFLEWARVDTDQVLVLNNPVHLDELGPGPKPASLVARYDLGGRLVLLTVGRMLGGDRLKGHDELIDVLPELARHFRDLAWLVVGDGPDRARLEERVRERGLDELVVFAGRVPHEEKRDHFLVADAYALPSTTEGFGIAYLEAAACGLPVLGSVRDGSRDALRDGELGVLVDPLDRRDLFAGLVQILRSEKTVPSGIAEFAFPALAARMRGLLDERFREARALAA